eukprot:1158946-Pelagomonas_calceolata.AAC.4
MVQHISFRVLSTESAQVDFQRRCIQLSACSASLGHVYVLRIIDAHALSRTHVYPWEWRRPRDELQADILFAFLWTAYTHH